MGDMTQEQLKIASGVPQSTISKLLRGAIVNPSLELVMKLEAALPALLESHNVEIQKRAA